MRINQDINPVQDSRKGRRSFTVVDKFCAGFLLMGGKAGNKSIRGLIKIKYDGRCAYCGVNMENSGFTIDHIEPIKRHLPSLERGPDTIENMNPCCPSCNTLKSDYSLEEFRHRITDRVTRLNNDSAAYRAAKRFGLVVEKRIPVVFYFERHE